MYVNNKLKINVLVNIKLGIRFGSSNKNCLLLYFISNTVLFYINFLTLKVFIYNYNFVIILKNKKN